MPRAQRPQLSSGAGTRVPCGVQPRRAAPQPRGGAAQEETGYRALQIPREGLFKHLGVLQSICSQ